MQLFPGVHFSPLALGWLQAQPNTASPSHPRQRDQHGPSSHAGCDCSGFPSTPSPYTGSSPLPHSRAAEPTGAFAGTPGRPGSAAETFLQAQGTGRAVGRGDGGPVPERGRGSSGRYWELRAPAAPRFPTRAAPGPLPSPAAPVPVRAAIIVDEGAICVALGAHRPPLRRSRRFVDPLQAPLLARERHRRSGAGARSGEAGQSMGTPRCRGCGPGAAGRGQSQSRRPAAGAAAGRPPITASPAAAAAAAPGPLGSSAWRGRAAPRGARRGAGGNRCGMRGDGRG